MDTRRVEWIIGVEYGTDFEKVRDIIKGIILADSRVFPAPTPFIALKELGPNSVNIMARCWVKKEDFWGVYFDINRHIYETLPKEGIHFPFPQLTIHQA